MSDGESFSDGDEIIEIDGGEVVTDASDQEQFSDSELLGLLGVPNPYIARHRRVIPEINRGLLSKRDDALFRAADHLADTYFEEGVMDLPPDAIVGMALNATYALENIKSARNITRKHTDRSNAISALFLDQIVYATPRSKRMGMYDAIQRVRQITDEAEDGTSFLSPKALYMQERLVNMTFVEMFAEELAQDPVEITDDEVHHINTLFEETERNRDYGVKLSYKESPDGGSWIYEDIFAFMGDSARDSNMHRTLSGYKVRAVIMHSSRDNFEDLTYERSEYNHGVARYGSVTTQGLGIDFSAYLLDNGHLYLDRPGRLPVQEIFRENDAEAQYHKLLAEVTSNYFDLVMPAEIVERVSEYITRTPAETDTDSLDKQHPDNIIKDILLPRLRIIRHYINNEDGVTDTSLEDDAPDDSKREYRYHEVGWFRRTLPEGWKASLKARQIAEEYGVELRPNETFVRPHTRGNENKGKISGYHQVKRKKRN